MGNDMGKMGRQYTHWAITTEEELSYKMYFFKGFISGHHKNKIITKPYLKQLLFIHWKLIVDINGIIKKILFIIIIDV